MSSLFSEFAFLKPQWLWMLPLIWLLAALYMLRFNRKSMWEQVCDLHLLAKMKTSGLENRGRDRVALTLTFVLSLAVLASAGPSWRNEPHPVTETIAARVIILDLSSWMMVPDIKPNRMQHALEGARRILSSGFEGETGLIVYSGAAFVVSPLSKDANTLLSFLQELGPESMPVDGNRIDVAIRSAQSLLLASISRRGQIIIITSGTNNIDPAIEAAFSAAKQGHRLSVLAIGSESGGPLVDADGSLLRDKSGKFILAKTDFEQLEQLAQIGNGSFLKMTQSGIPVSFFIEQLASAEQAEIESSSESNEQIAINDGYWIIWLMLPFAIFLFRRNALWLWLIALILPLDQNVQASELSGFWTHSEELAWQAYQKGDFPAAAKLSDRPMLKGNALFQMNKLDQALLNFQKQLSAESYYNQGHVLVHQEHYAKAIIAYKKALKLRPDYRDASYNLRLVEIYLEQQINSEAANNNNDETGESNNDEDQSEAQSRLGAMGQEQGNPAESEQPGSGFGASVQLGVLNDPEQFSGREERLEPVIPGEQQDNILPDPDLIEQWINSLPQASSELFRRKFLRDYERQKQQQR